MNYTFEQEFICKIQTPSNLILTNSFIALNRKRGILIEESLEVLRDKTLAMDADILLKKVKACPKKSMQEGHSALDMSVQLGIIKIIEAFR